MLTDKIGLPHPVPHGGTYGPTEKTMAKFIQICASQDDLFALDEEGDIYQHNFNAKMWVKLGSSRSDEARAWNGHRPRAAEQGDRGRWSFASQT